VERLLAKYKSKCGDNIKMSLREMGFGVGATVWWFAFYVSLHAYVCNLCDKNQQDALFYSQFISIISLCMIPSRFAAHHQEVLVCTYSIWYVSCVYIGWLLAGSGWNWFLAMLMLSNWFLVGLMLSAINTTKNQFHPDPASSQPTLIHDTYQVLYIQKSTS